MSRRHFSFLERTAKPAKPYPDFPLFPHANGCWAKKIRGRLHYFGPWIHSGPDHGADAALTKYLTEKDALHAGQTPRPDPEAVTVKDVCNAFLNHKQARLDSGELSRRTWNDAKSVCDRLVSYFGKARRVADLRPDDFSRLRAKMAQRWGPTRLGNVILQTRSVFKYALDAGLIDRPVQYGPEFRKPSAAVLRRHRAQHGERMLEAAAVRQLVDAAPVPLRAMILLGVNCGFGNTDCGTLPLSALDLDAGWINFPRPKTGIPRRCPLWPETAAALRETLALRPQPKDQASGLVFVNARGQPWIAVTEKSRTDNIGLRFMKLLQQAGLYRAGVGPYVLRHVFRTVADEVRDPVAIDLIMGHADPSMAGHYRERISDARLKAVADHVRAWLFAEPTKPAARIDEEE
jgi:integrase